MHDAHDFLRTLAVVLCVAAVTTVVFQRLKQPVVFGYLLAGMIVGPHVPIPIVVDDATVRTLAETGVVLLLFGLGLEFSIGKLIQVGPTAGVVAAAQSSLMVWIGYMIGGAFGWTTLERLYAGAMIAISSTTIIAKAFEEQRVAGKFRELVLGVLIIEDLIGIFLIAILTTMSASGGVTAGTLALTGLRLAVFLAVLIGVGLLVIPRVVRSVVRMQRPETTLIASIGICFAAALFALAFGYSVALGAFIAGSLVAESGQQKVIEGLVQPVRDVFAAIFFVSVGMLIDPALVARHWPAVVTFTAVVIGGKILAVSFSAFAIGFTQRTSVQAGMSLAQIGEFSFIIAGVGLATGATREFLYPIAVAVSGITTLTTPWLIRSAGPAASAIDRMLPGRIQTFVALYGSWIQGVRASWSAPAARSRTRRLSGLVVLDTAMIIAVVIGAAVELDQFAAVLAEWTSLSVEVTTVLVLGGAAVVLTPLLIGLLRTVRQLGLSIAVGAMPAPERGVDLAAAPRRALVVALQLAIVFVVALLVVAATQPFVPAFESMLVMSVAFAVFITVSGVALWRTATDLHGHARAGAEVVVAALAQQMAPSSDHADRVRRVHELMPGLGDPTPIQVEPDSPLVGHTLGDLDLRGMTGATVLAIVRDPNPIVLPAGREMIRAGDILAVIGSAEAIESCKSLVAPPAR